MTTVYYNDSTLIYKWVGPVLSTFSLKAVGKGCKAEADSLVNVHVVIDTLNGGDIYLYCQNKSVEHIDVWALDEGTAPILVGSYPVAVHSVMQYSLTYVRTVLNRLCNWFDAIPYKYMPGRVSGSVCMLDVYAVDTESGKRVEGIVSVTDKSISVAIPGIGSASPHEYYLSGGAFDVYWKDASLHQPALVRSYTVKPKTDFSYTLHTSLLSYKKTTPVCSWTSGVSKSLTLKVLPSGITVKTVTREPTSPSCTVDVCTDGSISICSSSCVENGELYALWAYDDYTYPILISDRIKTVVPSVLQATFVLEGRLHPHGSSTITASYTLEPYVLNKANKFAYRAPVPETYTPGTNAMDLSFFITEGIESTFNPSKTQYACVAEYTYDRVTVNLKAHKDLLELFSYHGTFTVWWIDSTLETPVFYRSFIVENVVNLSLFHGNYSLNGTELLTSVALYGGKSITDDPSNLFNVYIRYINDSAQTNLFPNYIYTVQRSPNGDEGLTFIDVYVSTVNLDPSVTYTRDFQMVITDASEQALKTYFHFVSYQRLQTALQPPESSTDVRVHSYNAALAFRVLETFTPDTIFIGNITLNGVVDSEFVLTDYDTDIFVVDGPSVYVKRSALSRDLKTLSGTVQYKNDGFPLLDVPLYAYEALHITDITASHSEIPESRLAEFYIMLSLVGGLSTYDAVATSTGNPSATFPSVRFVYDSTNSVPENTYTSQLVTNPSLTITGFSLAGSLATPAGGTTTCYSSTIAVSLTEFGYSIVVAETFPLLVYTDVVQMRTQLSRSGFTGLETDLYIRNTTIVFVTSQVVAGGYLTDTNDFLTTQSAGFKISDEGNVCTESTLGTTLTITYTDGKNVSTEASFNVYYVPDTVFTLYAYDLYIFYPTAGTDTGRNRYLKDGSHYFINVPSIQHASITSYTLQNATYDGSTVLVRSWTSVQNDKQPDVDATQFTIVSDVISSDNIYRVYIECTEESLPGGALFAENDITIRTEDILYKTHVYEPSFVLEDRGLGIHPTAMVFDPTKIGVNYLGNADPTVYVDYSPSTVDNKGVLHLGNSYTVQTDMVVLHNTSTPLFTLQHARPYDTYTVAIVPSDYTFTTIEALKSAFYDTSLQFATAIGVVSNVMEVNCVGQQISDRAVLLNDVVGIVAPHAD